MIKGSFYILLFYFLGELLSRLIHGFIPGSVLGMILLFLVLYFKILHPENVRSVATAITKNMAVFFVPVGVGLMVQAEMFSKSLTAVFVSIIISTILTMITVAKIQERFESKNRKAEKDE